MTMTKDGKAVKEAVQATVARYGATQDELIPILNDLNREIGFLPKEALDEVSSLLRAPKSQLFSVATFYRMLSTKQRGRHVIQFCESAPCHVVGGREVWHSLQDELHLRWRNQRGRLMDACYHELPGCLRCWSCDGDDSDILWQC